MMPSKAEPDITVEGPLFYLVAGEASGDFLGQTLIASLRKQSASLSQAVPRFAGIGGAKMTELGFESLFPLEELSLMGFSEILPHIPRLRRRMKQTLEDIAARRPALIVTIDSPGFNFRLAAMLRRDPRTRHIPLAHYVAPTVWAYKPERAKRMAKLYDLLLLLLPFEPPYFDAVGLPNRFTGHPVVRDWREHPGDGTAFRNRYGILPQAPLLTLLPGSRRSELARHLPIFLEAASLLRVEAPMLSVSLIVPPHLQFEARRMAKDYPSHLIFVDKPEEKRDAFAAASVTLAKSGTVALEVSLAGSPLIVAYRVSAISAWLLRRMIRVPYVTLVNLLLKREAIPEFLQERCTAHHLARALLHLLDDPALRDKQRRDAAEALTMLDDPADPLSPGDKAAEALLELLNRKSAPSAPAGPA